DCLAMSTDATNPARGGGVYATGTLTLMRSTISNSTALSSNGAESFGGAAYVSGFSSHYSTVSGNDARAAGGAQSFAGGVVVTGIADVEGSTISQNYASSIGALWSNAGALIANSTISGNVGASGLGGVATSGGSVNLFNSTIAFNRSIAGTSNGNGLYMLGGTLTLDSSIIADNSGEPGATDLAGFGVQVAGGHSLVTSSTLMLPVGNGNIEGVCPKLDPLLDNGGYTHTHGLNHASPAIDTGNAGNTTLDQRGAARPTGIAADIGALERQPTDLDERILASNFDGFCDF
ncbi:MAG TPA: choice-of-anchor Q domain-containing protein, partial [Rhodanobacteraceae bacterium]|nr:choice-of-anchor Q domain-containing protein [Rhodanobacteraceae bacterium]